MERNKRVMMRWRRWWGDSILVGCGGGRNWRFLSLIEESIRSPARTVKMELKEWGEIGEHPAPSYKIFRSARATK